MLQPKDKKDDSNDEPTAEVRVMSCVFVCQCAFTVYHAFVSDTIMLCYTVYIRSYL